MSISENLRYYKDQLPAEVRLIAVSKTKPVTTIMEAYHAGQRVFGENKAQDMADKYGRLPSDIQWHFIGHLQTNKVKLIAPFVKLIHAVDSLRLLKEINKQAHINNRVIDCLLQFHIAEEDTKFGLNMEEATDMLSDKEFKNLINVSITGVMGMATLTEDEHQISREFEQLHQIFAQLKNTVFMEQPSFCEISMGMSDDYKIALEKGSTMIRIGTGIFGARNYS
jgi:hypothetical protein